MRRDMARKTPMLNAIEAKEKGNKKEEEPKNFWWAVNNDNFTLMCGQEMDAVVDQKIRAEEAERAV